MAKIIVNADDEATDEAWYARDTLERIYDAYVGLINGIYGLFWDDLVPWENMSSSLDVLPPDLVNELTAITKQLSKVLTEDFVDGTLQEALRHLEKLMHDKKELPKLQFPLTLV